MLLSLVLISGIALGIFLGVLLLTLERGNKAANRYLGIIMILMAVFVSDFAISKLGIYINIPHIIETAPSLLFLVGPFFLFYIKALLGEKVVLKGKLLLHFMPFVLLVIYWTPFYLQSPETKLEIYYNDTSFELKHKIIILIQAVHAIVYSFIIKKYISARNVKIHDDIKRWGKKCLGFLSLIFTMVIIFYFVTLAGVELHPVYSIIIPLLITSAILSLGFTGLKHPIIIPHTAAAAIGKKYEGSTLDSVKADEYLQKLLSLMESEKLYLQSDLTLQKLAEILCVLPNHLSQVINDRTGQNFFDFVNSYRVKAAQELLSSQRGELLTILAICNEAGFNSKSSFNTAFKKQTGLTPSQFKRQIKEQKLRTEA